MRIHVFWLVVAQLLMILPALGEESYQTVIIADPYIELHTGPGSGYPIFHVIERGESITVLKRYTDWFQVRTQKGKEGWVDREQLSQTLAPTGEQVELKAMTQTEFEQRRWEVGAMGGEFGGAATLSIYGGTHRVADTRQHFQQPFSYRKPACPAFSRMALFTLLYIGNRCD
jgi:uncharacterized protein YraI